MHLLAALLLSVSLLYGKQVTITVLATTDLHGNILPYDYYTAQPAQRGLAKIATLIQRERATNPNSLLIDCGDTLQGAPLEGVYQQYKRTGKLPLGIVFQGPALEHDPMMLAMNRIGYDAMVVGNHEYNFGLKNFAAARRDAKFPWLSANTAGSPGGTPLDPYIVKTIAGVKIAVIGITTPSIPSWEKPENYAGLRFQPGQEAVAAALAELRAKHKPDLILVAAHAGLDRDLKTGEIREGDLAGENMVYRIATEVKGIDAIVFGHTHSQLAEYRIGDVLLTQPRNWGISLARVDFIMDDESGAWKNTAKTSRLIPVSAETPVDPAIEQIARPYHELAERFLNTPVAESPVAMDASLGRVEDTPLVDAIQIVQLHYTQADVSLTSLFNPRVTVRKGEMTARQIAALYLYDNELYVIEGTGKMLRAALENSARFFLTCADPACASGPLINRNVIGFNYDMAQGVEYEIDLTKPAGQRIQGLRFHGKPLDDSQPLRIAVNNYRAGGSAGYTMFKGAKIVWRSNEEIRDMMLSYYAAKKMLPAQADNNWRIVPEAAARRLKAEARSARPSDQ